jgi:hypothetical protein
MRQIIISLFSMQTDLPVFQNEPRRSHSRFSHISVSAISSESNFLHKTRALAAETDESNFLQISLNALSLARMCTLSADMCVRRAANGTYAECVNGIVSRGVLPAAE